MNALSFCQTIFDWVWKTSLSAAILTVLVFFVQWLLGKRLTPRLHYALSLLVLIRLLLPAVPASHWSVDHFLPQKTRISTPTVVVSAPPVRTAPTIQPPVTPKISAFTVTQTPTNQPSPVPKIRVNVPFLIWISGCLMLMGFAAWRYQKWSWRLKRGEIITEPKLLAMLDSVREEMGVRKKVTPLVVSQAASPAVFGIWNVRLILPRNILRDLTDEELRLVLRHEMAHVRRNDTALNTLLMAVQFLHWFNPLVWLALHRIRADREAICDAMVMRNTAPENRAGYGRLLLKLIEGLPTSQKLLPNTVTMVGDKHEIKRRIIMIKNYGQKHLLGGFMAIIAMGLLGCAAFTRAENPGSASSSRSSAVPSSTGTASVNVLRNDGSAGPVSTQNHAETTGTVPITYQWYSIDTNVPCPGASVVANVLPLSSAPGPSVSATLTQPDGQTATFTVAATGTAPLTYQWYFNTNNPGSGTPATVGTSLPPGAQTVEVSTTPADPSAPETVVVNGNATFSVAATGTTPFTYQWNLNGTNIPGAGTLPTATVSTAGQGGPDVPVDPFSQSLAGKLIGTWVLDHEDGPASSPSGVGIRMKNFTGTHWSIIQPDPKTGEIIFHQGGTYKIEGDKYFEHKDFAGENNKGGIGKTGEFTLKIEGDKLIQKGINNPWNETWKRVK